MREMAPSTRRLIQLTEGMVTTTPTSAGSIVPIMVGGGMS